MWLTKCMILRNTKGEKEFQYFMKRYIETVKNDITK